MLNHARSEEAKIRDRGLFARRMIVVLARIANDPQLPQAAIIMHSFHVRVFSAPFRDTLSTPLAHVCAATYAQRARWNRQKRAHAPES